MKIKYTSILIIVLMAYSPVYAADGYIGFGLGQSEINQGLFGEYGNGFKAFGGVRLNTNIAIEAAYLDFGNPNQNLFGVETKYEAQAFAAWAKGLWPISPHIGLFGKAGLANWKVDATTTVFGSPPSKRSQDGTNFAWGIGVSFNYWDRFSLQLEYEDINADIDAITLWSASALYTF